MWEGVGFRDYRVPCTDFKGVQMKMASQMIYAHHIF